MSKDAIQHRTFSDDELATVHSLFNSVQSYADELGVELTADNNQGQGRTLSLQPVLLQTVRGDFSDYAGGEPEGVLTPDLLYDLAANANIKGSHGFNLSFTPAGLSMVGFGLMSPTPRPGNRDFYSGSYTRIAIRPNKGSSTLTTYQALGSMSVGSQIEGMDAVSPATVQEIRSGITIPTSYFVGRHGVTSLMPHVDNPILEKHRLDR